MIDYATASKTDILKDNGLRSSSLTEAFYSMAYDRGHAYGMYEVNTLFDSMLSEHYDLCIEWENKIGIHA